MLSEKLTFEDLLKVKKVLEERGIKAQWIDVFVSEETILNLDFLPFTIEDINKAKTTNRHVGNYRNYRFFVPMNIPLKNKIIRFSIRRLLKGCLFDLS